MDRISNPQHPDLACQLPANVYYRVVHDLRGHLPPPEIDTPEEKSPPRQCRHRQGRRPAAGHRSRSRPRPPGRQCQHLRRRLPPPRPPVPRRPENLPAIHRSICRRSAGSRTPMPLTSAGTPGPRISRSATWHRRWTARRSPRLPRPSRRRQPHHPHRRNRRSRSLTPRPRPIFYARLYPRRAAESRRLGGLPSPHSYGPPEAPVLRQLLHGQSPTLAASMKNVNSHPGLTRQGPVSLNMIVRRT